MENPATWNAVQLTIHNAMVKADEDFVKGIIGASLVTYIYNALKENGFLNDSHTATSTT